jgi:hypothetical protein
VRRGDGEIDAQARAGQHERVRHVVAVAAEGQLQTGEVAEALLQREHIGQHLAGMVQVAQRVDDRHGRPARQFLDGVLREGAGHDGVHPAVQVAGDILDRLARADGSFGENRIAAELLDGQLEGEAGAQGSFFEEQADVLAVERAGIVARRLLHIERDVEQGGQFVVGEVEVAAEVGGRDSGDLLMGDGESGHGGASL